MNIKADDTIFWQLIAFVLSAIGFGAVSLHKVAEHGREIKDIQKKLNPGDKEERFMTAKEVDHELQYCDRLHRSQNEQIVSDIAEIKHTLRAGEAARNKARDERGHHLEKLTIAIGKLEEKMK